MCKHLLVSKCMQSWVLIFTDGSPMQRAIPRQEFQLECTAHYDPENVMYTVKATWNLTNQHPLVLDALLAHEFLAEVMEFTLDINTPSSLPSFFITFPQV